MKRSSVVPIVGRVRRSWGVTLLAAVAVAAAGGLVSASCGVEVDPIPDAGDLSQEASTTDAPTDSSACVSGPLDCTGKCGPISDPCTGETKQCGGCAPLVPGDGGAPLAQACDLQTNTCGKPKLTCADFNAECGKIKTSCGAYVDCPACPDGKECDPDTNKCKDCTAVTCQDVGFECGTAWLGCGDPANPANKTNCGDCSNVAGRPKCNSSFNVCEPSCVPKSAKEICDAAKAKRGVQCGIISDGCGGTVNCSTVPGYGCPAGQSCGVRGIANRCDKFEPPLECSIAGMNCNPSDPTKRLKSACTGAILDCGSCTAPDVCNDNGVCGAPCKPKTCAADFADKQCGAFPDGCKGTVTCGCPGGGAQTCRADNTCCTKKTCASDYPGKCGTGFDDGCGGKINCGICAAGTETCIAGGGNTSPPAAGVPGVCCKKKTCVELLADAGAGSCGSNLDDGCGGKITCGCALGTSCTEPLTVADGAVGKQPIGIGHIGTCCGRNACSTCASIPDNCGAPGATINCSGFNCGGGQICGGPGNAACCTPPTCGSTAGKSNCNTQATNACTTVNCTCPGGQSCVTTYPGAGGTAVCCAKFACAANVDCGTNLSDQCGGTITNCACPIGMSCSSSVDGVKGTCQCPPGTPYTCANVPGKGPTDCGTYSNGCTSTINCGCAGGQVCQKVGAAPTGTCCTPLACPAVPAVGTACGVLNNQCGGVTANCPCPSPPESRFACVSNVCKCTPLTPAQCGTRTGVIPDGCGGTINCGG